MSADLCPVWVSRRWWPWPRRYMCKGMYWGAAANGLPLDVLCLILGDERKVFIHAAGRVITYGRRAYEWTVEQASREAGQKLPVKGAA
jgi:hypothetical protein